MATAPSEVGEKAERPKIKFQIDLTAEDLRRAYAFVLGLYKLSIPQEVLSRRASAIDQIATKEVGSEVIESVRLLLALPPPVYTHFRFEAHMPVSGVENGDGERRYPSVAPASLLSMVSQMKPNNKAIRDIDTDNSVGILNDEIRSISFMPRGYPERLTLVVFGRKPNPDANPRDISHIIIATDLFPREGIRRENFEVRLNLFSKVLGNIVPEFERFITEQTIKVDALV